MRRAPHLHCASVRLRMTAAPVPCASTCACEALTISITLTTCDDDSRACCLTEQHLTGAVRARAHDRDQVGVFLVSPCEQ